MDIDPQVLQQEIASLWQRTSIRQWLMRKRSCPQLEQVCGITERDAPVERREKLISTIQRVLDDARSQQLLLVALGLSTAAHQSGLEQRLRGLSREWFQSPRTLRRHVAQAGEAFALAAVVAQPGCEGKGYRTDHFDATVTYAGDSVRVVERRKIITTRPGLTELHCLRYLPRSPEAELFPVTVYLPEGMRFNPRVSQRGRVRDYLIDLPRPLELGQVFQFEVEIKVPVRVLDPCYIVQPDDGFASANVTVEFDPQRPPTRAWRVDRALPGEFFPRPLDAELLRLDPSARLVASFRDLEKGRCYGIAWE